MAEGILSKIFSREGAKTLQGADNWVLQGLGGLLGAGYGAYDYDYPDTIQGWGGLLGNVGNAAAKGLENTINEAAMDATMQVAGASDGKKVTDLALGLLGTNALVPFRAPRGSLPAHVWQGSPHKYGPEGARESLKHIGKGEGAQAYGWGRYDAGAQSVGQQYQGNLSYKDTVRNFREALPDDAEFEDVMDLVGTGHFSEYQDRVLKELAENDWLGFDYPSQAISAAYRDIDNYDPTPSLRAAIKDSGYLYKHDLPDEDIARYLDWDAPLSEQPGALAAIRKHWDETLGDPDIIQERLGITDKSTGQDLYNALQGVRQGGLDAQKAASEALRKAGIPGLKYYDGMSRGAGEGTRNYVTWDQDVLNRMKLLERNGEPMGLLDAAADLPMDEASRMARAKEMGFGGSGYHLTDADIDSFTLNAKPESHSGGGAIWVRDDPSYSMSAHVTGKRGESVKGVNDMPLMFKNANPIRPVEISKMKADGVLNPHFPRVVTEAEGKMLMDMGYTHAKVGEETAIFDPKNIRSRFAKFDPAKRDSANLLASGAPGIPIGLLGIGGEEDIK